jgi:hypothetical protein
MLIKLGAEILNNPKVLRVAGDAAHDWQVFLKSDNNLRNTTTIDPVTLAVLQGRLEQVADEMDATLFRNAFNPIIAEAHYACHGLYDAVTGDTLVQGKSGLPVFIDAMSFAVRLAAKVAGGKTPVKNANELFAQGFKIVIFPGGTVRATAHLLQHYYGTLQKDQSTLGMKDMMMNFEELNEIIGTPDLLKQGSRYS